jgi:hypothetical protein
MGYDAVWSGSLLQFSEEYSTSIFKTQPHNDVITHTSTVRFQILNLSLSVLYKAARIAVNIATCHGLDGSVFEP